MYNLKKIFTPLLTVILFVIGAFLLVHPLSWSLAFQTSLILFLHFVIILCAIYFKLQGLITFGAFSLLTVFLHSLRMPEFSFFPLASLAATISIIYLYCLKEGNFTQRTNVELDNLEEERNVLSVELNHLGLENSSFKQKLQRYITLKGLTETLSSTLSLDEIFSLVTGETFRIIGKSNACLLYLVDKEKQELDLVNTRTVSPSFEVKLKKGDEFDNWVFKQRTRLMVMDTKKDFRFNIRSMEGPEARAVRSLIVSPLIRENKLVGILRLDNPSPEAYDADDLRLLDVISDLAAVVIENSLLYQQTETLARTDGLTGLFVHRYFQERFDEEISRALWTNSRFAFLMIDIDNFKSYNDRYGHIAGDIVLRKIAQLISSSVRPGDIVARYGGEEFAVLLVETPKSESLQIAEHIRRNVEKKRFVFRREVTELFISGGLSFFPEHGEVKEELIEKADQALYKAKLEGKNKICTL